MNSEPQMSAGKMMKFWNFSSTLGRPNAEEKERKRRVREAQLQQIQRELTLDRRLITKPHRAKTFRNSSAKNGQQNSSGANESNLKFRSKSTHKLDEESQFVSRLRFLDVNENHLELQNRGNSDFTKRHSTSFCTPDDDQRFETGFYGMRRRYNTTAAFDSEDTDFTGSTSKSANIVTFASPSSSSEERNSITIPDTSTVNRNRNLEQRLRFSDQLHHHTVADMSIASGTNRSSHTSFGDTGENRDNRSDHEDPFGEYRSAQSAFIKVFTDLIWGLQSYAKMRYG